MNKRSKVVWNPRYSEDQARRIYEALHNAGLKSKKDWHRHLWRITSIMRTALAMEHALPLPYARPAAKQLDLLMIKLAAAAEAYSALPLELQYRIDEYLPVAASIDPLLMASLLPAERPVAERLLQSGRFQLGLKIVSQAASLAAEPLASMGKPAVVPEALLASLPHRSAAIVKKNAARPRTDALFQATGAPKNRAIRYAVQGLMTVFKESTGKPPKMYVSTHALRDSQGYGGNFYPFAAAAIGPTRLVRPKVLGSNILAAYRDDPRSKKKVNTPQSVSHPIPLIFKN